MRLCIASAEYISKLSKTTLSGSFQLCLHLLVTPDGAIKV